MQCSWRNRRTKLKNFTIIISLTKLLQLTFANICGKMSESTVSPCLYKIMLSWSLQDNNHCLWLNSEMGQSPIGISGRKTTAIVRSTRCSFTIGWQPWVAQMGRSVVGCSLVHLNWKWNPKHKCLLLLFPFESTSDIGVPQHHVMIVTNFNIRDFYYNRPKFPWYDGMREYFISQKTMIF